MRTGFFITVTTRALREPRAFGRETNFVPKRIPNLLPSGFQGVYLASWGALIRPVSHNRHIRPKGQRPCVFYVF